MSSIELSPIEQAIGRPLREAEKAIDVELLDAAMNEAKDELEAAIRDEMLAKAKIWQRRGYLPALELTVEMSRPLEALYELGRVEAYNELIRLRYNPTRSFASRRLRHGDLDPLRDRVRGALPGIRVRTERGLVEADFSGASSAALASAMQRIPGARAIASDVVSTALTTGLGATFDENADLIKCWEYTAVMDAATCVSCRVMDGTKYRTLTELYAVLPNFGPNPLCLGGGRCRCRAVPCVPNTITKVAIPPVSGRSAGTLADSLTRRAQAMEPSVTATLEDVVSARGGTLEGLEYRFKAKDSLAQKITREAEEELITEARAAREIRDALRYTMVVDTETYTASVEATLDALARRGAVPDRESNYWQKDGEYVGLNVVMKTENGYRFELQFHTPESWHNKQILNHPHYEAWRTSNDPAERRRLAKIMIDNSNRVPRPHGVHRLGARRYAARNGDDLLRLSDVDGPERARPPPRGL